MSAIKLNKLVDGFHESTILNINMITWPFSYRATQTQ